tara:strand:- start:204 stop:740 length:537 start_codon:yes stop_codon:yes gene_type:complete
MSEMSHIARPYAKAAFEFAKENKVVENWAKILKLLAFCAEDETVKKTISDPQVNGKELVDVFQVFLGEMGTDSTLNFLKCLAERDRFGVLVEISHAYEALKLSEENKMDVLITASSKLSAIFLESIKSKLEVRFKSSVSIQTKIDKNLIGGAIIEAGDLIIDGSVKNKIQRLESSLLA